MHSFLKEYGVGIVTLVFMAILIAMAGPFGIRIREYLLPQLEYASTIGSEEIAKATGGDTSGDDIAAMNSIYACLYTDGELVLSATPIDNTGRTDVDTDFGNVNGKQFQNLMVEMYIFTGQMMIMYHHIQNGWHLIMIQQIIGKLSILIILKQSIL